VANICSSPRKVLVTGAAGFIGSHLALRARAIWQAKVIGVDCFTDLYDHRVKRWNAQLLSENDIDILEVDLANGDLSTLPSVDLIYHAAAEPGISNRSSLEDYLRNNVRATGRLINWSKQLPELELLVFLSTSSVYGMNATVNEAIAPQPASYYGVTKLTAEQLCLSEWRQGNLPACSCRLYSVYGPRERPEKLMPQLLSAVFAGNPLPLCAGSENHRRSFTYIDDIVDGLLSVAEHRSEVSGKIYNLGTPSTHTTTDVIRCVEKLTNRNVLINVVAPRAGDQLSTAAVIDAAQKDLGYSPSITIEVGIQRMIEWYHRQHHEQIAQISC
jgi:nucleoside-diphosphate-sugar epimerase